MIELLKQLLVVLTALSNLLLGTDEPKFGVAAPPPNVILYDSGNPLDSDSMKFISAFQTNLSGASVTPTSTPPILPDDDNNGFISGAVFIDRHGNKVLRQIQDTIYLQMTLKDGAKFNPAYK